MNPFGCRHWPSTKGFALGVPCDKLRTYRRQLLVMSYVVGAWRDSAIRQFGSVCAKEGRIVCFTWPKRRHSTEQMPKSLSGELRDSRICFQSAESFYLRSLKYILAEVERADTY